MLMFESPGSTCSRVMTRVRERWLRWVRRRNCRWLISWDSVGLNVGQTRVTSRYDLLRSRVAETVLELQERSDTGVSALICSYPDSRRWQNEWYRTCLH